MIRKTIIILLTLAALGMVGAWGLSYVAPQHWSWVSKASVVVINLRGGAMWVQREQNRGRWIYVPNSDRHYHVPFTGSAYTSTLTNGYRRLDLEVILPGPGVLAFAAYPTLAFIGGPLRRYRRRKKNLCLRCGYNLTGNTSGVCPECGKDIVGQVADLPIPSPRSDK